MRKLILGVLFASAAAFVTATVAQADQRAMGTWKLNLAKSKFSPGPAPKGLTVKSEPAGKGVKLTAEGISADGKPTSATYTANYDGKDYPYVGSPTIDTVSLRRVDADTVERTDKKAGKVVHVLTRVIAKDGKSFRVTVKGTNPKGEAVNNVLVFEKQ